MSVLYESYIVSLYEPVVIIPSILISFLALIFEIRHDLSYKHLNGPSEESN